MVNSHGLDVLCAGMYRACSTWQYEVAAHLVEEHRGGQRLGYLASGEYTALLQRNTRGQNHLEGDQGPRRRAVDGPRAAGRPSQSSLCLS